MKYKVGDKVRVRSYDDLLKNFTYDKSEEAINVNGTYFIDEMKIFCGKIVTISDVSEYGYWIKGDAWGFTWTDEMFKEPDFVKNVLDKVQSSVDNLEKEVESEMKKTKDKDYCERIAKIEKRILDYQTKSKIAKIEEIVPQKVVIVETLSGQKIKMVCDPQDKFSIEDALYLALSKFYYSDEYTSEGIEVKAKELKLKKYEKYKIDNALKLFAAQKELEEEKKKHEELLEHRRQKRWDKKQKQMERRAQKQKELEETEKERQIEIQKEAILRANREMNKND